MSFQKLAGTLLCIFMAVVAGHSYAQESSAKALKDKYGSLEKQLNNNVFKKSLHLESQETSSSLKGEAYALIDHPFKTVGPALGDIGNWCDILLLHINTKYCGTKKDALDLRIGKKHDQPLEDAYQLDFVYQVVQQTPDYLSVKLNADKGPLNTHDYQITLEAIPLNKEQTFLHITYAYGFGMTSKAMMQTYLKTIGRNKVGFTKVNDQYVGGMRGVVERNTMRYYLAIEAFLDAMKEKPDQQFEKRIANWYAATEHYPKQLRETDKNSYLEMKRKEYKRQQQQ